MSKLAVQSPVLVVPAGTCKLSASKKRSNEELLRVSGP